MPSVGFRPPASRPFFKKLFAVRTLPTLDEPRRHIIGKMTCVPFVIQRELFDSPVSQRGVPQARSQVPTYGHTVYT
jgi:hypothetical protein